jgi:hypothetical protein
MKFSVLFIILFLIVFKCFGQIKCMVVCFDIIDEGKSIDYGVVSKKSKSELGIDVNYLNCGDGDITINAEPEFTFNYPNPKSLLNADFFPIIVKVNKKQSGFYNPYYPGDTTSGIRQSGLGKFQKASRLKAGAKFHFTRKIAHFLDSLTPGEYEVSIDYIERGKLAAIKKKVQKPGSIDLTKYMNGDNTISGYFVQNSKNVIHFTVTE